MPAPHPDIRVSLVDLTDLHQSQISSYSRKLRPEYLVGSRSVNSSCYPCIDYLSHGSFYQIAISKCCAAAVRLRAFISHNHVLSACLIPHSAESSGAISRSFSSDAQLQFSPLSSQYLESCMFASSRPPPNIHSASTQYPCPVPPPAPFSIP